VEGTVTAGRDSDALPEDPGEVRLVGEPGIESDDGDRKRGVEQRSTRALDAQPP
jgi:hypothetical protein